MELLEEHRVVRGDEDREVGVVNKAVVIEIGAARIGHQRIVAEHEIVLIEEENEVGVVDKAVVIEIGAAGVRRKPKRGDALSISSV